MSNLQNLILPVQNTFYRGTKPREVRRRNSSPIYPYRGCSTHACFGSNPSAGGYTRKRVSRKRHTLFESVHIGNAR
jgi:hypothetical protein